MFYVENYTEHEEGLSSCELYQSAEQYGANSVSHSETGHDITHLSFTYCTCYKCLQQYEVYYM